jgi:3-deoxy-D-manno-octulosonate 8-phosphate phosphatase (KDO 8-P phosphatase)
MAIRLLALDVDGTLTDGGVYMDGEGREFKRFDIRDGMGIVRLRCGGRFYIRPFFRCY